MTHEASILPQSVILCLCKQIKNLIAYAFRLTASRQEMAPSEAAAISPGRFSRRRCPQGARRRALSISGLLSNPRAKIPQRISSRELSPSKAPRATLSTHLLPVGHHLRPHLRPRPLRHRRRLQRCWQRMPAKLASPLPRPGILPSGES